MSICNTLQYIYSRTCINNHLRRATTCEEQPPLKPTMAFYINLNLRRATTCYLQPATTLFMSQQSSTCEEQPPLPKTHRSSYEQKPLYNIHTVLFAVHKQKYITNMYLLFIFYLFLVHCYIHV